MNKFAGTENIFDTPTLKTGPRGATGFFARGGNVR